MNGARSKFPLTASLPYLIVEGGDQPMRTLLYNITTLADEIAELRKNFSVTLEITPPQYLVLMHIAQHQGQTGLTVTQVAKGLAVTLPHVTKEATILVDKSLIQRHRNPSDGRSTFLTTTPQSDLAINQLSKKLVETNDHLFHGLDEPRFRSLCSGIATVLDNTRSGNLKR